MLGTGISPDVVDTVINALIENVLFLLTVIIDVNRSRIACCLNL
jgi:hypothetical protein